MCDWPHCAGVLVDPSEFTTAGAVAAKPPSNQPQVTPFRFNRSPTLRPSISTVPLPLAVPPASAPQSSSAGSGSPVTVTGLNPETLPCANEVARRPLPVCPDTRFIAPTVDGPKLVSNELSFIE